MIRVLTCDNVAEAYLVKGMLANEGVESFLTNENITTLLPHFNNMLGGGVQVMVDESDYDKARDILREKISPSDEKPICPYCGSDNIKLGLGKKKCLWIINILLAVSASFPLGNLKPKYYCRECHEEF
jgi:hypothetical protein